MRNMVLLFGGGGEKMGKTENLERPAAFQEMEMKMMKWDCSGQRNMESLDLGGRGRDEYMEREMKLKWDRFDDGKRFDLEAEDEEFFEARSYPEMGFDGEEEDEEGEKGVVVVCEEIDCCGNGGGGYNKDMPPVDDVCPICFDRFTVPCKSNCGHWFCASCILEFWSYRSSIQPCKCPLCWCKMVNLKPETSQLVRPADDTVEVLKKLEKYNGLYVGGVHGFVRRLLALHLLTGRIFSLLIHPDGLRCVYYVTRLLGLLLAILYEKGEYEFVATGGLGIQRTFDMAASLLVLSLFVIGTVYRWMVRNRATQWAVE